MTLREVAKRAKVSSATVSRVLNDSGRVKAAARARVLRAADELNYHPNIHARTLARGRSRTLGMIVSNLKNPFFLDIFQALENDAHERGFEVVVANTDYRPEQLLTHVRLMAGRRVAGLAVIVSEMEPTLIETSHGEQDPRRLLRRGRGRGQLREHQSRLPPGHAQSWSSTCTRSAIDSWPSSVTTRHSLRCTSRLRSFVEAVRGCGDGATYAAVADEDSPTGGQRATQRLFASGSRPTAIVCVNDFMALGVLKALREMGLRIPGDVSVVGCDNISLSAFACPALTTINLPRERIGHLVSEALMPEGEVSSTARAGDPARLGADHQGLDRPAAEPRQ